VLPRANRVTQPADFRVAVRHGRRIGAANTVLYVAKREAHGPSRFGFIVAKGIGNAVTRNLVRRRLRAASLDALGAMAEHTDVIVRALPASAHADWTTLHTEIIGGVAMGTARA
jgi:ribonuclease P protein component